jgi:hypothetical protein
MHSLSRTTGSDPLLTEAQASHALNLSVRTLQAWRGQGRGPSFVRAGRAVRYRSTDLASWINEQTVSPSLRRMASKES